MLDSSSDERSSQTTGTWGDDDFFSILSRSMLWRNLKWQKWEIKGQGLQLVLRTVLRVTVNELITLLIIIVLWPLLDRPCLFVSPWTLLVCLFHSPEIGFWFQPAVSRLAPISCTHTPARSPIFVGTLSDVMHSSLPALTTNKTPKYRN